MYNKDNFVQYQATGLRDSDEIMFSTTYILKVGKECVRKPEGIRYKEEKERVP